MFFKENFRRRQFSDILKFRERATGYYRQLPRLPATSLRARHYSRVQDALFNDVPSMNKVLLQLSRPTTALKNKLKI